MPSNDWLSENGDKIWSFPAGSPVNAGTSEAQFPAAECIQVIVSVPAKLFEPGTMLKHSAVVRDRTASLEMEDLESLPANS